MELRRSSRSSSQSSSSRSELSLSPERNTLSTPAPELISPLPSQASPLEQNRLITQGYLRIAHAMQAIIDPEFRPGGVSRMMPNWFGFAPHASQEAGKGILGATIAHRIIDAAQGEPSPSVPSALDRVGLQLPQRFLIESLSHALTWYGLPRDVAAALASMNGALNIEGLGDPRTLWCTAQRFAKLYMEAPGKDPLAKAEAVVATLERCLNQGNVFIFTDIGGSAELYLHWRQNVGSPPAARVLAEFSRPGSHPDQAQRAYTFALEHAHDAPRPAEFARLLPDVASESLVVAAFALYEQSRLSPSPSVRDALIGIANNFLAYQEQFTAVQPAFMPPKPFPEEVPRAELMQALTPLICLEMGPVMWKFTDYACKQRDRDGRFLTSQATEYNWAVFADRWPPILQSFELGYQHPTALWVAPPPLIRPDGRPTGAD
ncbi:hypothetical protein [Hyalangium versicolor]|uniref:hypothetical protein n=1 Tax=Hyalangium versicolor TaxID=2861190 RepID=UPI001CCC39FB|nr:hypothetical protein [Hyalangium versicolor]